MTRIADLSDCVNVNHSSRSAELVDGVMGISVIDPCSSLPAVRSEHTAAYLCGMTPLFAHSRMVCEISDMEGIRYSTRPSAPTMRSAMRRAVRVLPVPHAITSCPLSAVWNPSVTFLIASF